MAMAKPVFIVFGEAADRVEKLILELLETREKSRRKVAKFFKPLQDIDFSGMYLHHLTMV